MTRHNQPARAAAARTFLASLGARGSTPTWTPGFHVDRIPPDMRRVRRASCGIWAATRHSRLLHGYAPLPTEGLERVGSVSGMMLQVCVNGARDIAEHPSLSTDPARVAAECAEAVSAGADAVHVHPKDAHGQDSLQNPDVGRWVRAVRAQCPGIPVGVTTVSRPLHSVRTFCESSVSI